MNRDENLKRLGKDAEWELIVIGGGAIGLGCALEAAGRGYKTLLLEANDFASGTSSRSSKMIHGGLRYLRQFDIAMVRQSLRERGYLLRTAGNWVKEQRIIIPLYSNYDLAMYKLGLFVYDKLAGSYNFTPSESISASEVAARLPGLNAQGIKGGVVYSDGIFDDARLAVGIAQAAAKLGARLINYIPVIGLMKEADKLVGVVAKDIHSGDTYSIRGAKVINAAGTYVDSILRMDEPRQPGRQLISQGSHLVLPREKFPLAAENPQGMLIPETDDGRLMFCLPWYGRVLIGTTDVLVDSPSQQPRAQEQEIDFILRNCRSYFAKPLAKSDILSVFAGQRSLVSGNASSKQLSRSHKIAQSRSGLISCLGGKWTTFRVVAKDALDKALGKEKLKQKGAATDGEFNQADALSLDKLLAPASSPTEPPGELLHPNLPYTAVDVVRAVREEMALTLEDVLARRTRALFSDSRAASECAPKVAEIMAAQLNKGPEWRQAALREFHQAAARYRVQ